MLSRKNINLNKKTFPLNEALKLYFVSFSVPSWEIITNFIFKPIMIKYISRWICALPAVSAAASSYQDFSAAVCRSIKNDPGLL